MTTASEDLPISSLNVDEPAISLDNSPLPYLDEKKLNSLPAAGDHQFDFTLFLFPEQIWVRFPFVLTLEGQYIVKNVVLVSAALVVGATARGGGLVAEPGVVPVARRLEEEARREADARVTAPRD